MVVRACIEERLLLGALPLRLCDERVHVRTHLCTQDPFLRCPDPLGREHLEFTQESATFAGVAVREPDKVGEHAQRMGDPFARRSLDAQETCQGFSAFPFVAADERLEIRDVDHCGDIIGDLLRFVLF